MKVLEAAGVGHRITHKDDLPEPREIAAIALLILQQSRDTAEVLARMAQALARDDDKRECPDPTGTLERGSPNTFVGRDRRAAALVDDETDIACERDSDGPLVEGARHVWVNRKRWARRSDELDCGARVGEGEPTVLLGADKERAAERSPEWLMVLDALVSAALDAPWAAHYGARLSRRAG